MSSPNVRRGIRPPRNEPTPAPVLCVTQGRVRVYAAARPPSQTKTDSEVPPGAVPPLPQLPPHPLPATGRCRAAALRALWRVAYRRRPVALRVRPPRRGRSETSSNTAVAARRAVARHRFCCDSLSSSQTSKVSAPRHVASARRSASASRSSSLVAVANRIRACPLRRPRPFVRYGVYPGSECLHTGSRAGRLVWFDACCPALEVVETTGERRRTRSPAASRAALRSVNSSTRTIQRSRNV